MELFGAYEIVPMLGAGGMDGMHRSPDRKSDRIVAIKVMLEVPASDTDPQSREQTTLRQY